MDFGIYSDYIPLLTQLGLETGKMKLMTPASKSPNRENAPRMFDRIAHRYDLLNHLLSFNTDKRWRKRLVDLIGNESGIRLLDLATGTGDQLITFFQSGQIEYALGVDPSEGMLEHARQKIAKLNLGRQIEVKAGTGEAIPADDSSFDIVSISFGIRNVVDLDRSLVEMYRVLKPDGRAMILEFSLPENSLVRFFYLVYFRHILPLLGRLISGDSEAYRYLNRTVETFPYGQEFVGLMERAGLADCNIHPLTFGVATIYVGHKRN